VVFGSIVWRIVRTLDVLSCAKIWKLMWPSRGGIVRAVGLHHQSVGDNFSSGV